MLVSASRFFSYASCNTACWCQHQGLCARCNTACWCQLHGLCARCRCNTACWCQHQGFLRPLSAAHLVGNSFRLPASAVLWSVSVCLLPPWGFHVRVCLVVLGANLRSVRMSNPAPSSSFSGVHLHVLQEVDVSSAIGCVADGQCLAGGS